ncbi:hypothetical protein [Actinophytocola glycyrrhizae]|uniref:RING-type domain-containing protein n=1 Tax=Actinophytocola glycyrrhizae TaxID=2044873 RepID=A0ABV9RVH0_9PSEU
MFSCAICTDDKDDSEKRVPPCCRTEVCAECVAASPEAVVRYQNSRYVCSLCLAEVTDPDDYDAIVPADTKAAMVAALAALAAAAPAANVVTVDDATLRTNAWQFGAYTHSPGCGSAVSIIDGCDTLNCPTCGVQINIAGGDPGVHTSTAEAFFREAQKFTGQTARNQLDLLRDTYPGVWDARFLTELVDGIEAGTLVAWIDSMADYVWGGFLDFLRQRVAPQAQGPDETSLFALIASVDANSADGQALSTHYYTVEEPGNLNELAATHARREVANAVSPAVAAILRKKFRNNQWWHG